MTGNLDWLVDVERSDGSDVIENVNGRLTKIEMFGKFVGYFIDEEGKYKRINLKKVGYIPGLPNNLFRSTSAQTNGMESHGKGEVTTLDDKRGLK